MALVQCRWRDLRHWRTWVVALVLLGQEVLPGCNAIAR